jgi:AraC family transcriptional regulator of adaptative response / DNA-3-methyladenine glycosylase II
MLDDDACYRALRSRDPRFDGRIFVGVTSTGIYCRPVCPARPAKRENCRFFPSAAAAQEAGFRPCLRCRPETTVHLGSWRGTSNTVSRGLALIAAGELDADDASVASLAERLGVGGRQLRRLFDQHLGASPITVAQTRRVLFAKQLLHETRMGMAEVALASGFGSLRRFNETFHNLFGRPPTALRRAAVDDSGLVRPGDGVTIRLRYRAPYDWEAMIAFLAARAVEGVELVDGDRYLRTVGGATSVGSVEIAHDARRASLRVTARLPDVKLLPHVAASVRRVFDLEADVTTIGVHLARDPLLAPMVAARPGLRTPGGWDGFELAVRAVLGQQVSVQAARKLASRLAGLCGSRVTTTDASHAALTHAFPTAMQVARANLDAMPMPVARKRALHAIARAALATPDLFQPLGTVEQTVARLRAIPGVGDWTAHYIALRAAREPDAFPASDVGLLRALQSRDGARPRPEQLLERAERWRPFRAYAAQHLWVADEERAA